MEEYDIAIIGGGGSGFAAAMYAGRFKLKTILFTGDLIGGLITWTDDVSNYPGIKKATGPEIAKMLEDHAREYDVDIMNESVISIEKSGKGFTVATKEKKYKSKTIIYVTGTKIRELNVPGEKELSNKGVNYCALCDGFFFTDKTVAVIGGSDSAAKEALVLTQYAKKLYLIYRGNEIRPEPVTLEKIKSNKKIEIITNTNVLKINGKDKVESVLLDKPYKGSKELKLDGVFVAVGHIPNTELAAKLGVKLNDKKEVMIDRESKTNVPGFFAAGDVADSKFKQLITGVGEAVTAVYSAYEFIGTK